MTRGWLFGRLFGPLAMILALACSGPAGGLAQDAAAPAPAAARLDAAKATLDGLEAALTRPNLTDARLQELRAEVEPIAADVQAVIADLQPRLDAAQARLAQLGPKPETKPDAKPDPKNPAPEPKAAPLPEAADIKADRTAQEKQVAELDATLKRARALLVQATQIDTTIGGLRRSLFTRSVLAQSYSLLDPRLWIPAVGELPSDGRAIRFLAEDWYNGSAAKLPGWQVAAIALTLLGLALAFEPLQRVARRVAARDQEGKPPAKLRKVLAAIWVAMLTTAVPFACLAVAGAVLDAFGVITPRLQPLVTSFGRSATVVALIIGLARGYLAPRRPQWRLPTLSDFGAEQLYRVTIVVAALVAVTRIVETLADTIAAGLPTAIASRGLLTALAAGAMALTLNKLSVDSDDMMKAAAARKAQGRDWTGALRLIFWALVVVVAGALLTGFVAFAAFLVLQITAVTGIAIALVLLLGLTDEGIAALFESGQGLGRMFVHTLGVKRNALDIVAIVLSGLIRVALISIAILLVLAPWRIESGDMLSTIQTAFFGFSIGDVTIAPMSIVIAAVLFLVAIAITHALQRWLEGTLLPRTRLDSGLQNSIKTSLGYLGFLIAVSLSLSQLGVSFERLAIVAGALSVGIGFGLQSIVNNFVSGLILLWERAVRVGDWIVVGDEQGYVRRINVRSTEIETFDRATVIVPNSNLVSGVVKNWLRNGHVGRIRLPFTLGFDCDPEAIRQLLIEEAKSNEHVLSIPSPQVVLAAVGEANLRFELICYLEDVEATQRASSDLLFAIVKRMRGIGLMQPAGPPTLASPVLDKLDAWLSARTAESANGDARR